jgi:hypothetical protein
MKRKQPKKNSSGSRLKESVTSPEKMTLPNKQNKIKKQMVDLTLDDHEEEQNFSTHKKQKTNHKTPMGKPRSQYNIQKAVQ